MRMIINHYLLHTVEAKWLSKRRWNLNMGSGRFQLGARLSQTPCLFNLAPLPSLAPGGGLYTRGGGLKGEIISTSPLPILLLLQWQMSCYLGTSTQQGKGPSIKTGPQWTVSSRTGPNTLSETLNKEPLLQILSNIHLIVLAINWRPTNQFLLVRALFLNLPRKVAVAIACPCGMLVLTRISGK